MEVSVSVSVCPQGAACLADMVCKASALRALFADGNRLGDDGLTILAVRS